jgi:hypothetical protein
MYQRKIVKAAAADRGTLAVATRSASMALVVDVSDLICSGSAHERRQSVHADHPAAAPAGA